MRKTFSKLIICLMPLFFFVAGCKQADLQVEGTTNIAAQPLQYTGHKQLILAETDQYGRAVDAHIQLKKADLPRQKRSERLYYNPSGWHNYKVKDKDGKYYWAYNRGHLIGYQFSGLNDEKRNLITMTRYLNAGANSTINPENKKGMLYYEYQIRNYLDTHPNDTVDYQVTPLYKSRELMARGVRLSFVAFNKKGQEKQIKISSPYVEYQGKVGVVKLPNTDQNLKIDYQTGRAQILK